jgi:hypothetical protein
MSKRAELVEATLADGKVLTEGVDAVRGTADTPMMLAEVAAKAREFVTADRARSSPCA